MGLESFCARQLVENLLEPREDGNEQQLRFNCFVDMVNSVLLFRCAIMARLVALPQGFAVAN